MKNNLYDHGYNARWQNIYVEKRERYKSSVTDFHEHDFYEINLILSGNVKALVDNRTVEGTENMLVLTKPNTPHFVINKTDILYSSLYLVFSEEFIESHDFENINLLSVFKETGNIITLTPEQTKKCENIINFINKEESYERKKLLVFYLLSYIKELSAKLPDYSKTIPNYIYRALKYIDNNYMNKITASDLADKLNIGRTTLMTGFKKHTGETLHDYIINCRLKCAIKLLSEGKTEYETAVKSGFGDSSSLIQCFKRIFKMTPGQYMKK